MRRLFVAHLGLLFALLVAAAPRADLVQGLHTALVPVENQSSQALAASASAALAEVLVKVSGSHDLLQNPVIVKALRNARSQVQQYAYIHGATPQDGLQVRFEFDSGYVTQLVTEAGAPLWTANRPQVLAWVVVEDQTGRYFINRDTHPEESEMLVAAFARRGVPIQIPLFDLADTAALNPQDVWQLDASALHAASARYKLQDIVAGRLSALNTGQVMGGWSYFYGDERIDRSVKAPDLAACFSEGVSMVAGEMSARYAVAPTTSDGGGVRMSVTGVSNYADYAGIVSWLESLELIEFANVEWIQGQRVEFRLGAQADAAQLAAIIELNERLVPVPPGQLDPQLNYQWQNPIQ